MHETSLVAELVEECEQRAQGRRVAVVRVRHATTIDDLALRELFEVLTTGTSLESARLEAEPFDVRLDCSNCGFSGTIGPDYVVGHLRICPSCGITADDGDVAELQLVDVVMRS